MAAGASHWFSVEIFESWGGSSQLELPVRGEVSHGQVASPPVRRSVGLGRKWTW